MLEWQWSSLYLSPVLYPQVQRMLLWKQMVIEVFPEDTDSQIIALGYDVYE